MSSAYFVNHPVILQEEIERREAAGRPMTEAQKDLYPGKVFRDQGEALTEFLRACNTEEWAELRWSS